MRFHRFTILTALACMIMFSGACNQEAFNKMAGDDIEGVLEDYYEAMTDGDEDDVEDLLSGKALRKFKKAVKNETLDQSDLFTAAEFDEIDDLEIDNGEAEATVLIEKDGKSYQQVIELEFGDGDWLITAVDEIELLEDEDAEDDTDQGKDEDGDRFFSTDERAIKVVVADFYKAIDEVNSQGIAKCLGGEALSEYNVLDENKSVQIEALRPVQFIQMLELDVEGDSGIALARVKFQDEILVHKLDLERFPDGWKIVDIGDPESSEE